MQRGLEELLVEYEEIIGNVVKKYAKKIDFPSFDADDIRQEALIGFIEAYNKYDGKEEEFIAYAIRAMEYKIRDLIVFYSNPIKFNYKYTKVWKYARRFLLTIEDAEEIAKETDLPLKTVEDAMKWEKRKFVDSLEKMKVSSSFEKYSKYENSNSYCDDLTFLFVNEFLSRLDERERKILLLLMKEKTQKEIAEITKHTQGCISKIIKREFGEIGEDFEKYLMG